MPTFKMERNSRRYWCLPKTTIFQRSLYQCLDIFSNKFCKLFKHCVEFLFSKVSHGCNRPPPPPPTMGCCEENDREEDDTVVRFLCKLLVELSIQSLLFCIRRCQVDPILYVFPTTLYRKQLVLRKMQHEKISLSLSINVYI